MDTQNPKAFELVLDGKTYVLKKMEPSLLGKTVKVTGYIRQAAEGFSEEDVKNSESLQMITAGAMFEHVPELIWAFLPDSVKRNMTRDYFNEHLTVDYITNFYKWATESMRETARFLPGTPTPATTEEKASPESTPPSV